MFKKTRQRGRIRCLVLAIFHHVFYSAAGAGSNAAAGIPAGKFLFGSIAALKHEAGLKDDVYSYDPPAIYF
jgi:hypothetical protein